MPPQPKSIQRRLTAIILLASGAVLLLTCVASTCFEYFTLRHNTKQHLTTVGAIIADYSTTALAFDNQGDAEDLLATLKDEPHIAAACLYDKDGKLFARYPANQPVEDFPAAPGEMGHHFEHFQLAGFQPVSQGNRRLGTLYLRSDMGAMFAWLKLYAGIGVLIMAASLLLAYFLSRVLQRQISGPILALADTARAVSDRGDYSVRAEKRTEDDEVGLLTGAFNQMLTRIDDQNQALSESEARVRAVIDSALSAVVVMDAEGRITDWNDQAEKMFGWTRQEALGLKVADTIIPLRYREAHRRGMASFLIRGDGPVLGRLLELSALRRDGTEFPVELSVSPLKARGVTAFCGFITDVTDRKRMEETRNRLAAIVQSSDDAILAKNMEGIITSWNRGAEKLFGYTESEAVGQSVLMLFPPDRVDEETRIRTRIALGESIDHYETVRVRKDGRHIDVSVTISPLKDADGRIIGASKIARDITESKQAAQRLQAQLARLDLLSRTTRATGARQDLPSILQVVLRSLEDNLPIDFGCVCLYDVVRSTLTVTSIGAKSQPLARELGISLQAQIEIDKNGLSRSVQGHLVYEPDINQVSFPFPQRLARGGLGSLVIAPLLVESSVFGILVAARKQTGGFTSGDCEFLRQLSEHVALAAHQAQLYAALQQAYEDLRQTQQAVMQQERLRALGQMASGIAHDINNAISPVALYTGSLLESEPNLSPRARDYLQTIEHAIDDVAATVARMREFYRQREPQLTLAPVRLNNLVQQVLDLTRARWSDMPQQRGLNIQQVTDLTPDLPVIMGVESEIREALTNLIFNAVDAMPDGGTLTLRTRVTGGARDSNGEAAARRVAVEVTDTGTGMDEDTRRRCLEPFFTTKGERGTGLGLAMVYGVVQRHSADIEIESTLGRGTTVRLSFLEATTITAGPAKPAVTPAVPARLRILIVDDDPIILKSLRDILETDGHVVTVANGGQAGIDAFAAAQPKQPFAVVISDLGMPHVDGRKVSAAIKGMSPATPVILLTGWGQRLLAEGDIPPHVDRVLNKPPKIYELREALAQCLESPKT